ncbi:hypothetical protein [Acidiphilium sp. PM]|uniref:hypothetical protein n=1 Tax=Acidiphilium sp. PM TaxID=1043206 RepID=UPI00110FBF70|nr:hypothetical protein [Acidiphilium sp. PM]
MKNIFLFVMLTLVLMPYALAQPVYDESVMGSLACKSKSDLVHLMYILHHSPPSTPLYKMEQPLIVSRRCFLVSPGQIAIIKPSMQSITNIELNFGLFTTKSGREFWSFLAGWKYVGNVPSYVH